MLPTLAATTLAAVIIYSPELEHVLTKILRPPVGLVAALVFVAIVGLPHINIVVSPAIQADLFTGSGACPSVLADSGGYYRCLYDVAWTHRSILVDSFKALSLFTGVAYAILFASIWARSLWIVRDELGGDQVGMTRLELAQVGSGSK
jgi:hypothetical protein